MPCGPGLHDRVGDHRLIAFGATARGMDIAHPNLSVPSGLPSVLSVTIGSVSDDS